jgi:hypothetical protein
MSQQQEIATLKSKW